MTSIQRSTVRYKQILRNIFHGSYQNTPTQIFIATQGLHSVRTPSGLRQFSISVRRTRPVIESNSMPTSRPCSRHPAGLKSPIRTFGRSKLIHQMMFMSMLKASSTAPLITNHSLTAISAWSKPVTFCSLSMMAQNPVRSTPSMQHVRPINQSYTFIRSVTLNSQVKTLVSAKTQKQSRSYNRLGTYVRATHSPQVKTQYVVIMEVLSISPDASTVELKSVNTHGYHYWLTEDKFKIIQKKGPRSQHYYTEQSAVDSVDKYDSDRKEKFVNYYKNNPEDFIKEMVRKTYESEADPEYGDVVIADAIKNV